MNIERQRQIQEQYRMQEINRQIIEIQELHPELLISGDLVFIMMKINGVDIPAMLDTGAQESVISLNVCRQLNLENQIDYRVKKEFQGVGHSKTLGVIHLVPIKIGSTHCVATLNVFDESSPLDHALIGINTMRALRISMNFKKNCIKINGESVPMMSNTDIHYATRKPFSVHPINFPTNKNRREVLTHRKKPKHVEGEYNRHDVMAVNKLMITGMNREDAMEMLDVTGGDVNDAMLRLSSSKVSLFDSME